MNVLDAFLNDVLHDCVDGTYDFDQPLVARVVDGELELIVDRGHATERRLILTPADARQLAAFITKEFAA